MSASTSYSKTRPPFFSHRFVRLLFLTRAAGEIGSDAVLMLVNIVHTEDAVHYSGPVRFFSHDLASQCGLSVSTMERARARAVKAGWLHYQPGAKRRPASYRVDIPSYLKDAPDGPTPGGEGGILRQADGEMTEECRNIDGEGGGEMKAHLPCPFPYPSSPAAPGGERGAEPAKKRPKKPTTSARNPLFDAVAEVCGKDPSIKGVGGLIGSVAAELAKADPPYTPNEVREFGRRFQEFCSYAARDTPPRDRPTPGELRKNIDAVRRRPAARPVAIPTTQLPDR